MRACDILCLVAADVDVPGSLGQIDVLDRGVEVDPGCAWRLGPQDNQFRVRGIWSTASQDRLPQEINFG